MKSPAGALQSQAAVGSRAPSLVLAASLAALAVVASRGRLGVEAAITGEERDANGAAAHLITKGEQIIIMGFEVAETPIQPKIVLLDSSNRVVRELMEAASVNFR